MCRVWRNGVNWTIAIKHVQTSNYRVGQKRGHRLMTIILSNLNRYTKTFSLKDSLVNLQLNAYYKIPPHLAYVAALPRETLI